MKDQPSAKERAHGFGACARECQCEMVTVPAAMAHALGISTAAIREKRERLAYQAMSALLARPDIPWHSEPEQLAKYSYDIARAMVREGNR